MSTRGQVQRNTDQAGTFYKGGQDRVPAGWPEEITCPNCGTMQATKQYHILRRKPDELHLLNPVLVCQRRGCGNVFSPTPVYLKIADESPQEAGRHDY